MVFDLVFTFDNECFPERTHTKVMDTPDIKCVQAFIDSALLCVGTWKKGKVCKILAQTRARYEKKLPAWFIDCKGEFWIENEKVLPTKNTQ